MTESRASGPAEMLPGDATRGGAALTERPLDRLAQPEPESDGVGVCPTELTRELTAAENRAWAAFLRSHARVTRRLEADLVAASHLPLAEYDVLTQLAAAEHGRLRMHELADRVLLSRAGLTRLIDRLVDDGLVERAKCGGDGRGSFAVLTENGRAHFRAAAPAHMVSVKRHFLDAYSPDELEQLADLLERAPER